MSEVRIGTSGWSYDHWGDVLYGPKLPVAKRLARYVEEFHTVELNASFYRWPRTETFAGWNTRLPEGFSMTVKAPRWLTHGRRLREPEAWIERLVACWQALGSRRGMLLVQLPPDQERDDERLDHFLACVPDWIRVTVEFRHPTWVVEPVFDLLSRHHASYVVMSGAELPCF